MTGVRSPGGGFIIRGSLDAGTRKTTRHATHLKNEAGEAIPAQKPIRTSFLSPIRHKPIPSLSHATGIVDGSGGLPGQEWTWHHTTPMPHQPETNEEREWMYFHLKSIAEESAWMQAYLKTRSIEEESRKKSEASHDDRAEKRENAGWRRDSTTTAVDQLIAEAFFSYYYCIQYGCTSASEATNPGLSASSVDARSSLKKARGGAS